MVMVWLMPYEALPAPTACVWWSLIVLWFCANWDGVANLQRSADRVLNGGILRKQGHNGFGVAFIKRIRISVDGCAHLFGCRHGKLLYGK